MKLMLEIRDSDPELDGCESAFVCEVKKGDVTVLRMPPLVDGRKGSPTEGEMIDFGAVPLVDFIAEYEGCYTPGQALEVFSRALDMVLAREGWDAKRGS